MKEVYNKLFGFFMFITSVVNAQSYFEGRIIDDSNGEPLAYSHILVKSSNRGVITNTEGRFSVECLVSDTLIISYISFEKKELPASFFAENQSYHLKPLDNEIAEVVLFGNNEDLYDLIYETKKNFQQIKDHQTKAYFNLETSSKDKPLELIECYYNSKISAEGIDYLSLKNGRIGMAKQKGGYFVSLSTTQIISDYNLLYKSENKLPQNPFHFSMRQLKKYFNLNLLSVKGGIYNVEFTPKDDSGAFFKGELWIDYKHFDLIKIRLVQEQLKRHPFLEISKNHKLDSLDFDISFTYKRGVDKYLTKVNFNYEFKYDNTIENRLMSTRGVLLFYDEGNIFDLPYFSFNADLTDYDKIVTQPYNSFFWEHNELVIPSAKMNENQKFFEEHGVLLHYNVLSEHNNLFKNRIKDWASDRIFLYQLNDGANYNVSESTMNNDHQLYTPSELYDFKYHIYVDRNAEIDSVDYLLRTLIDVDKSFYFNRININTNCFINVYFDLVEIEKRNIERSLKNWNWNITEVDSIYSASQLSLKRKLSTYIKEVEYGKNHNQLKKYVELIMRDLGVDNTPLLNFVNDFENYIDVNKTEGKMLSESSRLHFDLYNYGSALLSIGKTHNALEVLLEAYSLGDDHPWLYYNIALCYEQLGNTISACDFYNRCQNAGGHILREVFDSCDD